MENISVYLRNNLESLAEIGEILGRRGVNIEGIGGFESEGEFIAHLCVNDSKIACEELIKNNFKIQKVRKVFVFDKSKLAGKPGSFGNLCRKLSREGIKIDLIYAAENNKVVFGVDDLEKMKMTI